jgi:taurine dioxygenase
LVPHEKLATNMASLKGQQVAYKVEKLREGLGFGRQVLGLASNDIEREAVRRELIDYWINDGLILFRDSDVTPEFQIELSRVFGELEIHPIGELRDADHPELITLVSDQHKEGLFEVDGLECVAFLPWHSDLVFVDRINHGGLLTAKSITSWGGETGFIDQVLAYDLLPPALKDEIETLEVVYQLCVNPGYSRYGTRSTVRTIRVSDFEKSVGPRLDADFPPVVHPLVFVQPDTGRKVLNLSPFGALHILGHDDEAGHALLQRLVDHLVSCPAYHHSWRPSEMLLWDNWRMAHSVTGAPPSEIRVMQRTTITGDYGLGRKLSQPTASSQAAAFSSDRGAMRTSG